MEQVLDSLACSTPAELVQFLKERRARRESGLLMLVAEGGKSADALGSRGYSLRLQQGELISAQCGTTSGKAVIEQLAQMQRLVKSQWFPRNNNPSWDGRYLIANDALYAMLETGAAREREGAQLLAREAARRRLMARAQALFNEVYVGDGPAVYEQVSTQHPPADDPERFRNACAQALAPAIGLAQAQALLTSA